MVMLYLEICFVYSSIRNGFACWFFKVFGLCQIFKFIDTLSRFDSLHRRPNLTWIRHIFFAFFLNIIWMHVLKYLFYICICTTNHMLICLLNVFFFNNEKKKTISSLKCNFSDKIQSFPFIPFFILKRLNVLWICFEISRCWQKFLRLATFGLWKCFKIISECIKHPNLD